MVGQTAVAIGSPSGFQSTVTAGIISGLEREFPAELTGSTDTALVGLIQTDAPISPGNLAAPWPTAPARSSASTSPTCRRGDRRREHRLRHTFDLVVSVADQLIEDGEATQPYLGVSLTDVDPETAARFGSSAESGTIVTELSPGGPADEAGIEPEDTITAAGPTEVESSGDLWPPCATTLLVRPSS